MSSLRKLAQFPGHGLFQLKDPTGKERSPKALMFHVTLIKTVRKNYIKADF